MAQQADVGAAPVFHKIVGRFYEGGAADPVLRLPVQEVPLCHELAQGVKMLVVPGSQGVKRAAEAEGLDKVFMTIIEADGKFKPIEKMIKVSSN